MRKCLVFLFVFAINFSSFYAYAAEQGRQCWNWANNNTCGAGRCLPYETCQLNPLSSSGDYKCFYNVGCGIDLYTASGPTITNVYELVTPIAKVLFYGGFIIGAGFIIYSGYLLMVSEGNPDSVKNAKDQLTAAILGTIFILLSSVIFRVIIRSFFGLQYSG